MFVSVVCFRVYVFVRCVVFVCVLFKHGVCFWLCSFFVCVLFVLLFHMVAFLFCFACVEVLLV